MSTDKMKIIVDVDGTKKGSAEFDRMRVKTEGVERAVGQLRNKLLLFTFAAAAVTAVVTKLTSASIEQEKIFNTLENSINITGASYDNLKTSIDGYFASLQQSTIYGDTDTAGVLQQLTMLTGDYEESIKALPYVLDLAASGITDLGGATRFIGMGMSGNIEMLGRYMSEFRSATNETLKNMGATEKAAYMFDILKEKVGGLAEKELNTTAGRWLQFKNYWGDLNEAIGDKLSPILKQAAINGTAFIQSLTETSLETTIRELEELGVSAKEILELKKFSWNVQLEDINAELKKAGVNYEDIKDVTAEIKTLNNKDIAYTKAKARIQTEEITKISQIEDIYASIGASVEDYGRLHRNYNSYLSNSETELEAINMLEGLVLSTLMDETTEIKNQKKELADYSDLLIEREKLKKQIKLNGKKKIEFETSIKMLPFDTEGAKAAAAAEADAEKRKLEYIKNRRQAETDYSSFYIENTMTAEELFYESQDRKLDKLDEFYELGITSEEEYAELKKAISDKTNEYETDLTKSAVKLKMQGIADAAGMAFNSMGSALSAYGDMWKAQQQNEIDTLKHTSKYQKATAEERINMEQKVTDKYKDSKKRQWILEKAFNIAKIGIDTASAVVEALPKIPLAVLIASLGAAQLAMVLATPAPKFHSGGDFIVPPGYPNDSFPIMVESGERVQVTPSSETGNSNNSETNDLLRALLAKPVANTVVFDDVSMSQYVDRGRKNRNSNIL
jgi:hypothetical protein